MAKLLGFIKVVFVARLSSDRSAPCPLRGRTWCRARQGGPATAEPRWPAPDVAAARCQAPALVAVVTPLA